MTFSVCFIERKHADTQSIEKVFRTLADELVKRGITTKFQKLPAGNSVFGILKNLVSFRPEPADIYHITGHVHFIGLTLDPKKTVLTVHDLWILHNRTGLRRQVLKKLFFDWPLRRLKWITAISEATKRELVELSDADPAAIRVIVNPVTADDSSAERTFNAVRPTILQVGTAPHKNLEGVIQALGGVSCKLRIIGPLTDEQRAMLIDANIDFENDRHLDDKQMAEAYRSADLLVFCSKFEGFGLPIVEAQAAGLPVVTSDRDPMKDVAGEGAALVDPDDPVSIAAAIKKVVDDRELRTELIAAGYKNTNRFAPEVIADQYITLYKQMQSLNKLKT